MNPNRIREAVAWVSDRIRKGESADVARAIAGEDLEGWLEDLALTTLTKEARSVRRAQREAVRRGAGVQMSLPGMDHATLPAIVWDRDENGFDVAIPLPLASKAQVRREVELHRRAVSIMDRVVGGYEATLAKLDELGYDEDVLIAEIQVEQHQLEEDSDA